MFNFRDDKKCRLTSKRRGAAVDQKSTPWLSMLAAAAMVRCGGRNGLLMGDQLRLAITVQEDIKRGAKMVPLGRWSCLVAKIFRN